jgi:hypothetical protein
VTWFFQAWLRLVRSPLALLARMLAWLEIERHENTRPWPTRDAR